MARVRPLNGAGVTSILNGLRINQGITAQMFPGITFSPSLGITASRIDKLGMNIKSFREPLKRSIQQVIAPSIRTNFDQGGRPNAWPELSDATQEIQDRIMGGGDHPPLIKSGLMRRTMTQLNVWSISQNSAILKDVPDKIWYAKVHQAGYEGKGKAGRKSLTEIVNAAKSGKSKGERAISPIPARPFVMLQSRDVEDIQQVFIKWMGERIDRTWPI